MALDSAIEWTDATWNPVSGCTKVSPGCKFCYAERLTERFRLQAFTEIKLHPERLGLPLRWRAARRIFVNSMSDLFHEKVPFSFIAHVFDVMSRAPQHVFQVLTRRPERLLEWRDSEAWPHAIPANIWLGVSVESAAYLWRVDRLRELDVPTRFISAEPLLGSLSGLELTGISWVITGGESGGPPERALVEKTKLGVRPKEIAARWVREIRDVCQQEKVAFFHKQWGGRTAKSSGRMLDGREWSEYPRGSATSASLSAPDR